MNTTSPERSHTRGGLAPWQIRKVASYIDANLGGPIRSEELAALVRLNPCYFSRVFRNSFGDSPCEYVSAATCRAGTRVDVVDGCATQSDRARLRLLRSIPLQQVVPPGRQRSAATWRRARANPSVSARKRNAHPSIGFGPSAPSRATAHPDIACSREGLRDEAGPFELFVEVPALESCRNRSGLWTTLKVRSPKARYRSGRSTCTRRSSCFWKVANRYVLAAERSIF